MGKKFELRYGDGSSVSGEQYTDTIKLGGLTAKTQTLGAASVYSSGFSPDQFPPDGLVGMGFKEISEYDADPVFQTLVKQGKTTKPVFAFKLTESGSELFLGGTNSAKYQGKFTYSPVTQKVVRFMLL